MSQQRGTKRNRRATVGTLDAPRDSALGERAGQIKPVSNYRRAHHECESARSAIVAYVGNTLEQVQRPRTRHATHGNHS